MENRLALMGQTQQVEIQTPLSCCPLFTSRTSNYTNSPKEEGEYEYLCLRVRYQNNSNSLTLLLPDRMEILSSIVLEVDMYVSPISSTFDLRFQSSYYYRELYNNCNIVSVFQVGAVSLGHWGLHDCLLTIRHLHHCLRQGRRHLGVAFSLSF